MANCASYSVGIRPNYWKCEVIAISLFLVVLIDFKKGKKMVIELSEL